jgi:6,7-dimethyl-8-ribityllumazine synthase
MDANVYRKINGSAFRFGIARARFNEDITKGMLDRCVETLLAAGVKKENIHVVEVPGSVETTYVLDRLGASGEYDALIALGAIIKGATPHFDYISRTVSDGIREVTLKHGVPVVAGVITCTDRAQAEERSGAGPLNRGLEAAHVALEMAELRRKMGWG